jgi:hypothetical protein
MKRFIRMKKVMESRCWSAVCSRKMSHLVVSYQLYVKCVGIFFWWKHRMDWDRSRLVIKCHSNPLFLILIIENGSFLYKIIDNGSNYAVRISKVFDSLKSPTNLHFSLDSSIKLRCQTVTARNPNPDLNSL